ncbi:MAG: Thymidylate kinase [Parcubacteria group bacterium GW2011_GWF2_40_69]|nr:MAG: Thymidylate kinase [Parcubacteria group bacterium GW2011_GWC1_39_12]KKR18992.1 MAG: Thymidylate kinase [Parcubacteria group bacterium GW2011_GWF1_39_37]KKR35452.1 MAG: Thymidylate kinase [Parcubacteria group bacterium GW2011_GWC2_40_10]KKR51943.1 MAG: Thymidylate kinase [Parcubacteria group bacterium GW2011_GWE1_40_20]KKR68572.1 MAG: Thymidylate kinase [Parcubacteria group bacterium GW2011_GWF2_40_69]KKR80331.1 MAG: Thymidylate kinase [Parcubacteria group bacterium GW2011_GWD1_40_9]KK
MGNRILKKKNNMKQGKLIVIDGIDGSGKATQVRLLEKKLNEEKIKVKTIDFPRYYDNFFGKLIGEYLSGQYGDFIQTDPRVASVLYAADRFESSKQIQKWLHDGYMVIADRYASANQIHQGGKIDNAKERKEFIGWLDKMEHEVFKIPRPDLVIYLDVPFEVSKEWLKKKVAQRKKKYLKGKRDVAEDNLLHLKNSRNSALKLHKENKNWEKIECCKKTVCMSPEEVHEHVYNIIKKKFKI